MKQSEFLEIIELNKGKHRQPIEVLILGRKNRLFDSEKPVETRLVATFNITNTSSSTNILYYNSISDFTEIEIDGVVQPSVVSSYQFNTTGEHTVKYTLSDPTIIGNTDGSTGLYGCSNLVSVTIPKTVITIGNSCFSSCSSLRSITIPNNVTSICRFAFSNSGLTSITIPNTVTSLGDSIFQGCSSLTSVTLPNTINSIGQYTFYDCSSLTNITIPSGVISIGDYAFESCSSLTSITIPDSVTSIGTNVFRRCSNLANITIPNSVTSIGNYVFQSCSALTNIISLATIAPTVQSSTFMSIKTNGTLTVPSGSTGYDVWMRTGGYYLGYYNWTKVEQ